MVKQEGRHQGGVASPIWSATLKDPAAVQGLIDSSQWPALKKHLDTLDMQNKDVQDKLFKYPDVKVTNPNLDDLQEAIKLDLNYLEYGVSTPDSANKMTQDWFNKLVELLYIKFQKDENIRPDANKDADFQTWYGNTLKAVGEQQRLNQLSNGLSVLKKYYTDKKRLTQVVEYQEWAMHMHTIWNNYLDSQIRAQYALLEKMDAVLSTNKRRSIFARNDISTLNAWEYWVTRLFFVLCIVIVVILIVQNVGAIGVAMHSARARLSAVQIKT